MSLAHRLRAVPSIAWAAAFAFLLIFPGLGAFGFWDPWELGLADRAREIASSANLRDVTVGGRHRAEPPLDMMLSALGIRFFGATEFAARLGNAFMALAALLATYWAALGLCRRRAALLSALALGTMPLFYQQARQLNADMGLVCGLALACGGLGRFAWPRDGRRRMGDLAVAASGMLLGFLSGGALLGVALPCLSLAGGLLVAWSLSPGSADSAVAGQPPDELPPGCGPDVPAGRPFTRNLILGGARGRFAVLIVVAIGFATLIASFATGNVAGQYSRWLGGFPRGGVPTELFPHFIKQLGFGLFPWSALVVFALGRAYGRLGGAEEDAGTGSAGGATEPMREARQAFVASYLLVWASFGFAIFTLSMWITGDVRFAALAPLALAVGSFLDEALDGTRREPVLGFLIATGTVVVARDVSLSPEELASTHLLATINWPPLLKLGPAPVVVGLIVAAGIYLSLATRGPASSGNADPEAAGPKSEDESTKPGAQLAKPGRFMARWVRVRDFGGRLVFRMGRWGVHAAIAVSLLAALAVNHVLVPTLSKHFSFKPVFQSFQQYSKPGDALGRYRVQGHGASFYGAANIEDLPSQDRLLDFFRKQQRSFCLVSTDDLAALDAAFKGAHLPYHVIDASSSRFMLLSNQLPAGETDQNPLVRNVWLAPQPPTLTSQPGATPEIYDWHEQKPPWTWPVPASVVFGNAIELVGADFPSSLRRPGKIQLKLYFRVNQRPPPNHKVFVHIDTPGHPRLIGDHDPLGGAFPTSYWLPGEYIRDEYEVDVPYMTTQAGQYTVYVGFWAGGNGPRIKITSGSNDGGDRTQIGTIEIR